MLDRQLKVLKNELECVKRAGECDRHCENCDLLMDVDEIISVHEWIIRELEYTKAILEADPKKGWKHYKVGEDGEKIV